MSAVSKSAACVLSGMLWVSAWGAPSRQPDPYELLKIATQQLRSGNLPAAQTSLGKIRNLLTRHPEWDPDGVFLRVLLPPMENQIGRLRAAERGLDLLNQSVRKESRSPPSPEGKDVPHAYRDWATSAINRLRAERNDLIATRLPAPEDQAILVRTRVYEESERLLATEILRLVDAAIAREAAKRMPRDQQLETVQTRLGQIKKEVVDSAVERRHLESLLEDAGAKSALYQRALVELAFDPPPADAELKSAGDLGTFFSRRLEQEIETVRAAGSQSRADYFDRRSALARYRRFNEVLSEVGVFEDQSSRIEALAEAVEGTAVAGEAPSTVPGGWIRRSLLALASLLIVAGGLALLHRHRRGLRPDARPAGQDELPEDKDAAA